MKVFDMHCDTLSALMYDRKNNIQSGLRQNNHHLDLMKMKRVITCCNALRYI